MALTKITKSMMADESIDSDNYVDGSIDNAHIADDAIDSEHYAAGSIDEAHIADNAVSLAKMASGTDGNIISFDASGNPVAIATGNDGQVLTSTGAGSPPAFEDAAGGGKVLQVVQTELTSTVTTTSTSYTDLSGMSVSITPAATSSKILVLVHGAGDSANSQGHFQLLRDSTPIHIGDAAGSRMRGTFGVRDSVGGGNFQYVIAINYLDSPSTTSSVAYKLQWHTTSGITAVWNRSSNDSDNTGYPRSASSIIAIEIGA